MGEPKGVSYFIKSTVVEEKFVNIWIVPGGKKFYAKRIAVHFPSGTGGRLGAFFPPGCAGMVKVAVFYGKLQIWPSKEGEWLRGDSTTIWGEPFFELPEKETTLTLKGCSPNTWYDHDVTFYIIALPRNVALWMIGISRLVAFLERIFARLIGIPIPSK